MCSLLERVAGQRQHAVNELRVVPARGRRLRARGEVRHGPLRVLEGEGCDRDPAHDLADVRQALRVGLGRLLHGHVVAVLLRELAARPHLRDLFEGRALDDQGRDLYALLPLPLAGDDLGEDEGRMHLGTRTLTFAGGVLVSAPGVAEPDVPDGAKLAE